MTNEHEQIKLWRLDSENTHRQLEPLTNTGTIDDHALIVFPGSDTHHSFKDSIHSYFSDLRHLLGTTLAKANVAQHVIVASYQDITRPVLQTDLTNHDPAYRDPHIVNLVEKHIIPMLDRQVKVTLYGYSAGTIAVENVRRCLQDHYAALGYDKTHIEHALSKVVAITLGTVDASIKLDSPELMGPQFTSVIFNSLDDKVAQKRNPNFDGLKPNNHRDGQLSLTRLSPCALLVTTHTKTGALSLQTDFSQLLSTHVGHAHLSPYFLTPLGLNDSWKNPIPEPQHGHARALYTRANTGSPPMGLKLLKCALRNAITREDTLSLSELLSEKKTRLPASHGETGQMRPYTKLLLDNDLNTMLREGRNSERNR